MGKKDEFELENESNFTVATVPRTPKTEKTKFLGELWKIWPLSTDTALNQLEKLWKAEEGYAWNEIMALQYHNRLYATVSLLSVISVGSMFHKTLKITGTLGALSTLMPVMASGTLIGLYLHAKLVVLPMCHQPERGQNYPKRIALAVASQLGTSVGLPLFFAPYASIYFAAKYNTFPVPNDIFLSSESRKYLLDKVIKPSFRRNRKLLITVLAVNVFMVGVMTFFEGQDILVLYRDKIKQIERTLEAKEKSELEKQMI